MAQLRALARAFQGRLGSPAPSRPVRRTQLSVEMWNLCTDLVRNPGAVRAFVCAQPPSLICNVRQLSFGRGRSLHGGITVALWQDSLHRDTN